MTPRAFSFNSPHGACPDCQGLGAVYDFDPARVVPDESKSLADGRDRAVGAGRPRSWSREALDALQPRRSASTSRAVRQAAEEAARPAVLRRQAGDRRAAATRQSPARRRSAEAIRSARTSRADAEPAAAVRGGTLDRAGGARALPRAAAVSRRATASGCKAESRAVRVKGRHDRRVRRAADRRGAAGVRGARAHRARDT